MIEEKEKTNITDIIYGVAIFIILVILLGGAILWAIDPNN